MEGGSKKSGGPKSGGPKKVGGPKKMGGGPKKVVGPKVVMTWLDDDHGWSIGSYKLEVIRHDVNRLVMSDHMPT